MDIGTLTGSTGTLGAFKSLLIVVEDKPYASSLRPANSVKESKFEKMKKPMFLYHFQDQHQSYKYLDQSVD